MYDLGVLVPPFLFIDTEFLNIVFIEKTYSKEKIIDGSEKDLKVLEITVEEKPTGEIFAGAGTGTTGSSITGGIKENNYLGLGIKLDTNFVITDDSLKGKFSVINPKDTNEKKFSKGDKIFIDQPYSQRTDLHGYFEMANPDNHWDKKYFGLFLNFKNKFSGKKKLSLLIIFGLILYFVINYTISNNSFSKLLIIVFKYLSVISCTLK